MNPRITLITLGVDDLDAALRFYQDGFGWPTPGIVGEEFENGAVVFFELESGLKLALWPRASLSRDAGLPVGPRSATEFTLAHNVGSKKEVDAAMDQARQAGAIIVKAAADTFWGGYAGYFQDPDGHLWEVAWNPSWEAPARSEAAARDDVAARDQAAGRDEMAARDEAAASEDAAGRENIAGRDEVLAWKEAAVEFLRLAASGEVREAFGRYAASDFRHHNPYFKGDADSLMEAMAANAAQNPEKILEVQRVLQEGDLVTVHSRVRQNPGDRGGSVVHIFRFEGDRVAELWDIGMPVPEESPNVHGMF